MADQDPMCWAAWQNDPNAMWNWNGLYREGVAGDHHGAIPDGQLCSAGHTGGTPYAALDDPGPWQPTPVDNNFTLTTWDQANHGADYYRIYITQQGFNPHTDQLTWNDLELVTETGPIPPGQGQPQNPGVTISIDISAPDHTGHHIVYMIWQASHFDQTFYSCSDITFPGGPTDPPTDPTDPPTDPTDPPTDPTDPPTEGECTVSYTVQNDWGSGFTASVEVANTGDAGIANWQVGWEWPGNQQVSNYWSATISQSGSSVTAGGAGYNSTLAAGQSTTFGFNGSYSGANSPPTGFTCTAG